MNLVKERAKKLLTCVVGKAAVKRVKGGRAQKFLIQLIDSCERLGWKVVPAIQLPEDECVNSFSVSP